MTVMRVKRTPVKNKSKGRNLVITTASRMDPTFRRPLYPKRFLENLRQLRTRQRVLEWLTNTSNQFRVYPNTRIQIPDVVVGEPERDDANTSGPASPTQAEADAEEYRILVRNLNLTARKNN